MAIGRRRKYATREEAMEARRIQLRHWHLNHPRRWSPQQHSKPGALPRLAHPAKPVHQVFRRIPPPVPGSIAFALLYGERR